MTKSDFPLADTIDLLCIEYIAKIYAQKQLDKTFEKLKNKMEIEHNTRFTYEINYRGSNLTTIKLITLYAGIDTHYLFMWDRENVRLY